MGVREVDHLTQHGGLVEDGRIVRNAVLTATSYLEHLSFGSCRFVNQFYFFLCLPSASGETLKMLSNEIHVDKEQRQDKARR